MVTQSIAESLYRELLFTSLILLVILLINNLVLYRQKLTSHFSMMLLCGAVMCVFEVLWDIFDDHAEMSPLIYLCVGFYTMAFLNFAAFFNRYFWERFGIPIRKKWLAYIAYGLPNAVILILCFTTPWTHLFFMVDEAGIVREMPLYRTLFYGLMWLYTLSAMVLAVRYLLFARKKDANLARIARSLIVFVVLLPAIYIMQRLILGDPASDYLALSLAVSIALVYLTANVNLHALLESRAQVEAVEAELRVAAKIQSDALPPPCPAFPDHPEVNLRASMSTAKEVGGDFYDYFVLDANRICFLIADVSGKGMPAALFMMTTKTMIKDYALTHGSTAEIFTAVNARLCENNDAGMFATAWIGILDTRTMTLQYTNAGHNYPVLQRRGEPSVLLKKKHGLFLAGLDDTEYRFDELSLAPGDRLLLYTDGVTEAHSKSKELYGNGRLFTVLDSAAEKNGETVLEEILNDVNAFAAGEPQFDGITMVLLSIQSKEGKTDETEIAKERDGVDGPSLR